MGTSQRRKGHSGEREVVRILRDAGIPADRIIRQYRDPGLPDIRIANGALTAEVKRRGSGFAMIYAWLEKTGASMLWARADRRPWIVIMPESVALSLIAGALSIILRANTGETAGPSEEGD